MSGRVFILFLLICSQLPYGLHAQTIKGEVLEMDGQQPVSEVSINNIYTNNTVITDTAGKFMIAASHGQLLEFSKPGYKIARVRIPQGDVPNYFKILITKGVTQLPVYVDNSPDAAWKRDSTRFHEIYKSELDFPRMTSLDVIEHPFTAMSKRNQEIWAFQDQYNEQEQQKYVDHFFSRKMVNQLTGLTGDSLDYYMVHFRPTYPEVRMMNEYNLYRYIKNTVHRYRAWSPSRLSR